MIKSFWTLVLAVGIWMTTSVAIAPSVAVAQVTEGVPITVYVLDEAGKPIPTAVVRHPDEQDRHRVNTSTGAWTGSVLYLPDGSEIFFEKGMILELEVSAPGYVTSKVVYQVRKRKNKVTVQLKKMDVILEDDEMEDPVIQFGRDKPIE